MGGLDVVIVSYHCRQLLHDCLTSLRDYRADQPTRVIVVDNASHDGTAEMIRAEFPEVELIPLADNAGFAAANNVAIRLSGSEFVLALHPDTRLTAGALDRLLELMDTRRDVGICGPRLELEDGNFDHAARRSFPTPRPQSPASLMSYWRR